jgi:phage host-nuclease inhibitor protein Gam
MMDNETLQKLIGLFGELKKGQEELKTKMNAGQEELKTKMNAGQEGLKSEISGVKKKNPLIAFIF